MFCVVAFDRRRVGAALVDRDLLGNAMMAYRLAQEPQCGIINQAISKGTFMRRI
jgi:hypothetical protein